MHIIDGKKIRDEILENIKREVALLDFTPVFSDVLVGEDPGSVQYVNLKKRTAESVGIKFHNANFPKDITTEDLIAEIKKLNTIPFMCGLIVQLPLPPHIDRQSVLDAVDSSIDVDCLGRVASEKFYSGNFVLGMPAAMSSMRILDSLGLDLTTKNITVLGHGPLVGRPVAQLLQQRNLKVEVVTSKTPNKDEIIKNSDIIISGMGQGKYIKGDMLKDGVVVIDAGTSELDGGLVGDVDLESLRENSGYVSPVPGGVGPVTVAMLLQNVLTVAKSLK